MFSIFHFFAAITAQSGKLATCQKLDQFPFDGAMLSCTRSGKFPDMAIRINRDNLQDPWLCGGELIELKDAKSYSVPSFNSSIPTGEKPIADLTAQSGIGAQMEKNGDDVHSLPVRQVYYLLRGRRKTAAKVCLVHGSFFETITSAKLLAESFGQVIDDMGGGEKPKIAPKQSVFATSRIVKDASVSLRFRVMTEARPEANILKEYDDIGDNTANLVVPLHGKNENERSEKERRINNAAQTAGILQNARRTFRIKHPFNGYFWVLQTPLK